MLNEGPDEPFGGPIGIPAPPDIRADPLTTGRVMRFRVGAYAVADPTTPPERLVLPAIPGMPPPVRTRKVALLEAMALGQTNGQGTDGPVEVLLGTANPTTLRPMERLWMDPVTENPGVGDTEIWEFYNFTGDAHPMHVHEVQFKVLGREGLIIREDASDAPIGATLAGDPRPAEPTERGRKDTVISLPGDTDQGDVPHGGTVRLALPHRRARGQRDDAALPHRPDPARPADAAAPLGSGGVGG
jgi:FtsP/CotA-like multicopper oxidase with cupredoxin domain